MAADSCVNGQCVRQHAFFSQGVRCRNQGQQLCKVHQCWFLLQPSGMPECFFNVSATVQGHKPPKTIIIMPRYCLMAENSSRPIKESPLNKSTPAILQTQTLVFFPPFIFFFCLPPQLTHSHIYLLIYSKPGQYCSHRFSFLF